MSSSSETPNPLLAKEENLTYLKKYLEKEGEKKVAECMATRPPNIGKSMLQIILDGEKEFERQTGRQMTYSEMREMYG